MHLPADMAIVGRDCEQAELATALTNTRAGYGRAVLLLGEAGMGKSMLADWLVSQAEQAGMQVARGASAAGMPPLWPHQPRRRSGRSARRGRLDLSEWSAFHLHVHVLQGMSIRRSDKWCGRSVKCREKRAYFDCPPIATRV
jgi:hypothetical protein